MVEASNSLLESILPRSPQPVIAACYSRTAASLLAFDLNIKVFFSLVFRDWIITALLWLALEANQARNIDYQLNLKMAKYLKCRHTEIFDRSPEFEYRDRHQHHTGR
jgi:hypothetical protein